ncbi:MAG: hypothetical protein EHM90_04105 [Chloroflexi bacterium]|nr:MAG: hypothetical protein EHM90_04105 [Chloroflexota bacterium]
MSQKPTRDPIDELRAANPLRDDQLPPSSRDRVWSRIQEARMEDKGQVRAAQWTIAASGVALVAVMVAALTLGGTAAPPPQTGNEGSGGGAIGICLAFTIEDLQARDFAFDGTVTAVSGNMATFTVNDGFWGAEDGASVTLQADLMTGEPEVVALEGGPLLVVGDRYLVSGDDNIAWSCGYTQVFDEAAAAEWAAAAP